MRLPKKWAAAHSRELRQAAHGECEKHFRKHASVPTSRSLPPRTRQISRACGDCENRNFASRVLKVNNFLWPAMACANDALGPSPLREAFGGVTQDLFKKDESCTLVSR